MRECVFDVETTGLDPLGGHRVIEIAAAELANAIPTGRYFHCFLDPGRPIDPDATRAHGMTADMLAGKPPFSEIADFLLTFLGDDPIVAHNGAFDMDFIDAELGRLRRPPLDRTRLVDTLQIAREQYPGLPNSLDALARRFKIEIGERKRHNAMLDVHILSLVYLSLQGGRQGRMDLLAGADAPVRAYTLAGPRTPRLIVPSAAELAAHAAFVGQIKGAVWQT